MTTGAAATSRFVNESTAAATQSSIMQTKNTRRPSRRRSRRAADDRKLYAQALCRDPDATLDDLREVVATLEELERIARRVLGGEHPRTMRIDVDLRDARAALAARETPSPRT